jgi:hypothetical protein
MLSTDTSENAVVRSVPSCRQLGLDLDTQRHRNTLDAALSGMEKSVAESERRRPSVEAMEQLELPYPEPSVEELSASLATPWVEWNLTDMPVAKPVVVSWLRKRLVSLSRDLVAAGVPRWELRCSLERVAAELGTG